MNFIFCLKDQSSRKVFQEDKAVDKFTETVASVTETESLDEYLARVDAEALSQAED